MAGFTLSRALFGKNVGPSPGAADPIFPGKNWRPFLVIIVRVSGVKLSLLLKKTGDLFGHRCRFYLYSFHSFTRVSPLFPTMQKICRFSCGALFVGAPVRPNMLSMPKSAADGRLISA